MNSPHLAIAGRWSRFKNSDFCYYFMRDKVAIFSFAVFMALLVAALLAPWIAPTNPYDLASIDLMNSELPPAWLQGEIPILFWEPTIRGEIFSRPYSTEHGSP